MDDDLLNKVEVAETQFGKIRYIQIGPPDGEVILFSTGGGVGVSSVHGFRWLAQAGYRVICINRPGYYDLPVDIVNSFEGHADIYHEVLSSLGVSENCHVFGLSMGGLSALFYAQKYSAKSLTLWSAVTGTYLVNKASAESPLGKLVLSTSGKKLVSWMIRSSAKYFPKLTIQEFLKTEADLNQKQRAQIAEQIVSHPDRTEEFLTFVHSMTPMEELYIGMMDEVDKASQLGNLDWSDVSCPTLAIHSPIDIDVPLDHAKRIETMIPNIQMVYVEAAGHFVWWGDEGERVKQLTINHLNQHSSIKL